MVNTRQIQITNHCNHRHGSLQPILQSYLAKRRLERTARHHLTKIFGVIDLLQSPANPGSLAATGGNGWTAEQLILLRSAEHSDQG